MRTILAAVMSMQLLLIGVAIGHARDASAGFTPRGYRYDSKTCAGGFQTCRESHLKTGWQTSAASSYCSQACGVFPPQQFDRHSGGNW